MAVLTYHHETQLFNKLRADFTKALATDSRTRLYVIFRDKGNDKLSGRFLFGGRRAPPWTGFAPTELGAEDDVA